MKYRNVSYQRNQEHALYVLRKAGIDPESTTIPVDPEHLTRAYNIPLNIITALYKNFHIKGLVYKYNGDFSIGIDEYHYYEQSTSSIFTIGEELGHIVLHLSGKCDNIESPNDWFSAISEDLENHAKIESQARVFSSNLILPPEPFARFASEWLDRTGSVFKKKSFGTVDDFALEMSISMAEDIEVSPNILYRTLLRWPDRCVDRLWDQNFRE